MTAASTTSVAAALWRRYALSFGGRIALAAVGAGISFFLLSWAFPLVYTSEASIDFVPDPETAAPPTIPPREVERVLGYIATDPGVIAAVASQIGSPTDEAARATWVRAHIDLSFEAPMRVRPSFSAHDPEVAQRGCGRLALSVLDRLRPAPPTGANPGAGQDLERKLHELARFASQHGGLPSAAGPSSGPASPDSSAQSPLPDATLRALEREQQSAEARLVVALARRDGGANAAHEDNPYDDEPANGEDSRDEISALKRKIAGIRAAILARRLPSSPSQPTTESALAAIDGGIAGAEVEKEFRRLVEDVVQAEKVLDAAKDAGGQAATLVSPIAAPPWIAESVAHWHVAARLGRGPSLPTEPTKPRRGWFAVLGAALGAAFMAAWPALAMLRLRPSPVATGSVAQATPPLSADAPAMAQPTSSRALPPALASRPSLTAGTPEPSTRVAAPTKRPSTLQEFLGIGPKGTLIQPRPLVTVHAGRVEVVGAADDGSGPSADATGGQPSDLGSSARSAPSSRVDAATSSVRPPPAQPEIPQRSLDTLQGVRPLGRSSPGEALAEPISPVSRKTLMGVIDPRHTSPASARAEMPARSSAPPSRQPTRREPERSQGDHASPVSSQTVHGLPGSVERAEAASSVEPFAKRIEVRPLTGWIPSSSMWQGATDRRAVATLAERFKQGVFGQSRVVGVVGSDAVEREKSRVAMDLAFTLASSGIVRVLLVEGNFNHPAVSELLGIRPPPGVGFSQQLQRRVTDAATSPKPWVVLGCQPALHALSEGTVRALGLLNSRQLAEAITEFRAHYDVVVIDGPTIRLDADFRALRAVVDGFVFVVAREPGADDAVPSSIEGRVLATISSSIA